MTNPPIRKWPFVVTGIFVCVTGGFVGGFFGLLGGLGFAFGNAVIHGCGLALGVTGGVLAGGLWIWRMSRISNAYITDENPTNVKLLGKGVLWGLVVGILATALLHGGLMIVAGELAVPMIVLGLIFGAPAGAITGLVCGLVWRALADRERRNRLAKQSGGIGLIT